MAQFLKQSTAFTFRIGPFVDSTDGVTAETALTIAQADIQISKAGGAFAQTSASPTTTHDADGWYQCPLTSTDTGTVGTLTVQIVVAGALPVWKDFMVLPANVYDSLVSGTDLLDVNTAQWLGTACATPTTAGVPEVDVTHNAGTAITAAAGIQEVKVASIAANAITATSINADAITAAKVADDVSTEIRDKIILRTTLRGTATTGGTTTSIPTSAMSPATTAADQLKGRIVIFDHDTTTAALRGQATDITASSASATPTLTVTALTTAPASGDTFTIV